MVGRAFRGSWGGPQKTTTIRGEPAIEAQSIAPRPCIRLDPRSIRDHEAANRFDGKATRGADPLSRRHSKAQVSVRITATSDRYRGPLAKRDRRRTLFRLRCSQAAGRKATPAGISPVVTMRHSVMSSFGRAPRSWPSCARPWDFRCCPVPLRDAVSSSCSPHCPRAQRTLYSIAARRQETAVNQFFGRQCILAH